MILVAGGTGTLGRRLVQRLMDRGLAVRVLTRDAARVSACTATEYMEVVEGDVRDRATLRHAMAGVDTVVSAVHGFAGSGGVTPASVDRDGNAHLIEAAAAADASFVLMSVVGAAPDSPMDLCRMKYAAEERLRGSGVPWTIVRATPFLETWIALLEQTASGSGQPLVFGRGDNPIRFVSARDVAALVERVVVEASARSQLLEIGGTEPLSLNQLAAAVQRAAGRVREPRHVPRAILRTMAFALRPFKPDLARQACAALVLDTTELVFDSSAIREMYPDLPSTTVADLARAASSQSTTTPIHIRAEFAARQPLSFPDEVVSYP